MSDRRMNGLNCWAVFFTAVWDIAKPPQQFLRSCVVLQAIFPDTRKEGLLMVNIGTHGWTATDR